MACFLKYVVLALCCEQLSIGAVHAPGLGGAISMGFQPGDKLSCIVHALVVVFVFVTAWLHSSCALLHLLRQFLSCRCRLGRSILRVPENCYGVFRDFRFPSSELQVSGLADRFPHGSWPGEVCM